MLHDPLLAASVPTILAQYEAIADGLWDWSVPHEKALEYVTQVSASPPLASPKTDPNVLRRMTSKLPLTFALVAA